MRCSQSIVYIMGKVAQIKFRVKKCFILYKKYVQFFVKKCLYFIPIHDRGQGRLVDLIHAHALDPSARTTFENFATNQLTPYSAS